MGGEAARIAEEAHKLARVIGAGNMTYRMHSLTYAEVAAIVHLIERLAEVVAKQEPGGSWSREEEPWAAERKT